MIKTIKCLVVVGLLLATTHGTRAHALSLSVHPDLPEGLISYLLPRFTLKTQVRFTRLPKDGDLQFIVRDTEQSVAIFDLADGTRGYLRAASWLQDDPDYVKFKDWLLSDAGRATILDYQEAGQAVATPVDPEPEVEMPVVIVGDAAVGEALSLEHCSRCHKVDRANKYSGMDSSPSFHAMRGFDDWFVRFSSFYTVSPHKALISVQGSGISKDRDLIPIAPIDLTIEQVNDIVAFVHSLEPLDLGRPIQYNP